MIKALFSTIKRIFTGEIMDEAMEAYVQAKSPKSPEEEARLRKEFWSKMARYKGY
jgi:hypothetical protein